MDDRAQKTFGVKQAWAVWNRRKWLGVLVFAAPFSAAITLATFLPNLYRSSTTVLVEHQQLPEAFVTPTVTGRLETRLQTISQEILSRSRLEGLINRFGLYSDLRHVLPPQAVIERMRDDIQLELKGAEARGQGGATIAFAISYQGSDPETVALVTNTLASFYVEENLKVRGQQASGTAEFFQSQLREVKQRLDEHEQQVSEFKKRHIGELPQQMEANLATLERLNTQLRLNGDAQTRAVERRGAVAKQLTEVGSSGTPGGPDATAARLARLKQELMELSALFSEKYPDVIRVKTEIALLERQLARPTSDADARKNEPVVPVDPIVSQLKQALSEVEGEIRALKVEQRQLQDASATYQRRVENTPRREQEFQELSRDYESTKELYRSLLKRHEEAQLAESMEQRQKGEQFRILDPAIASRQSVAPNRVRLILIGLVLSLGLAVGAVMLTEQLDNSFHTKDDLRALSAVPVLGSIPRIITDADVRRRRWRFYIGAAVAMLGLTLIIGASYLIAQGNMPLLGARARSFLLRA